MVFSLSLSFSIVGSGAGLHAAACMRERSVAGAAADRLSGRARLDDGRPDPD